MSQPGHAFVELRDLTKTFTEGDRVHAVFEGLDLAIPKGSFIVLLGRSGTGKSTLLNLICGIDLPDSGEVILDGISITRLSEQQRTLYRRHHIGLVFQFFNLIPTLKVDENLLLPLELKEGSRNANQKRIGRILEQIGLVDRASSFPDRLSGGEQQRVAIARALIHEPLLLLADEPTGNLDLDTGRQILELMERLARDRNKTLSLATHSHEVAARADQVYRIRDRRLVRSSMEDL
ncbi:MAG: ABC transporter ATP-binding protein [Acidobacteriota bacterium]